MRQRETQARVCLTEATESMKNSSVQDTICHLLGKYPCHQSEHVCGGVNAMPSIDQSRVRCLHSSAVCRTPFPFLSVTPIRSRVVFVPFC